MAICRYTRADGNFGSKDNRDNSGVTQKVQVGVKIFEWRDFGTKITITSGDIISTRGQ